MPDPTPAAYSLLPWVRRGLAVLVSATPATAAAYYASLETSLVVNGAATPAPGVRLYGPGDITSLDPRAVIRTEPRNGSGGFEPNYLAAVEFGQPDFPWLFTPWQANGERLTRPWICLVVVPLVKGITITARADAPALLEIDSPLDPFSQLPDLDTIDFWAHTQLANLGNQTVQQMVAGDPAAQLSRIVCPRRLDAGTSYAACLVPTFRAGVNAGLGLPVHDDDVAPAWDSSILAPFRLPVYYQFRFQTGAEGDFASLARRLHPPKKPISAGKRPMDASQPKFGAADVPGAILQLEGALMTVGSQPSPWPPNTQQKYEQQLRKVLTPPTSANPVVTPPVYGQTQTGSGLPATNQKPVWLAQLNLDPRTRAAAGAAAQVVARDQEALVASSWDQLGEIRKANQLLRQAQLARQVSQSMQQRHLDRIPGDGVYLQVTAPVHARVRISDVTMRAAMSASHLPVRSVSGALRRVARPRGPIGRRMRLNGAPRLVDRLNLPASSGAQAITAAGPLARPSGMVVLDDISPAIQIAKMTPTIIHNIPGWLTSVTTTTTGTSTSTAASSGPVSSSAAHDLAGNTGALSDAGNAVSAQPVIDWSTDPTVPDLFKGSHPNLPPVLVFPSDQSAFAQMQANFRNVASVVGAALNTAPPSFPDLPPLGGSAALAPARATLRARLNPEQTIVARMRVRLRLGTAPDALQPLTQAPAFPQPMYAALAELSPEWMLPGISEIELDEAALVQTNPRFVEAFMVGLNEEFARELLWRDFPVGLNSTYFQSFWGGNNGIPDIPPVETFDPAAGLGGHTSDHSTGGRLVLLIRAELFRRYPNAVVSAVRAEWRQDQPLRKLGTEQQFPNFRGEIGTDVTFFGFNLDDPRGDPDPAKKRPGWYFVIQEHATEPRFGLEPDKSATPDGTWNDTTWNDVTLDRGFLNPLTGPPTPPGEPATWGASAAAMAYILMRRPVRVALHGQALLPEDSQ